MPLEYRLKKEKDFDLVFKKGKRLFSDSLTMVFLPAKEIKVGFGVGKKHGKSVKRNYIKRLLRESFRSFLPLIGENFFFVFIPKVKNADLKKYVSDMEYLLKKGGIIKKNA